MEVDLLDFAEQCRYLIKQALGKHAGEFASGGFARWKHVVLHCFRLEEDHSYRETPTRLEYISEVRDVLELDQDDLPDYSTVYESFGRLKMWVCRALLRVSARQHLQPGHATLDSTFFDRRRASSYFRQRSGSTVQTLKVTTLTNVESLAGLIFTSQFGGSMIRRPDHRSSAETRTIRSPSRPITGSEAGTLSAKSLYMTSSTLFTTAGRQQTQPQTTRSTEQTAILSGG